jgi:hypothetical protein
MTPVQYTLNIDVVGISLWVKREAWIDVLFPMDTYDPAGDQHHTVTRGVGAKDPSINGMVTPIFAAAGWIEEPLSPHAAARAEDAVFDTSTCVAALRLPFGMVAQIPTEYSLVGPCLYGKYESLFLSHGMRWFRTYTGNPDVEAEFVDQATRKGAARLLGSATGSAHAFKLTYGCLSLADRFSPYESILPGQFVEDYTMLGVLTQDSKQPFAVPPQYIGGTIGPHPFSTSGMRTHPRKPCPPGWADPAH